MNIFPSCCAQDKQQINPNNNPTDWIHSLCIQSNQLIKPLIQNISPMSQSRVCKREH
eukprot:c1176_g1_i1 orf=1-168(-)